MRRMSAQLCSGNRSACDRCHAKKLKCSRLGDGPTCSNCQKEGTLCIYSPPLEGGRPRKRKHSASTSEPVPTLLESRGDHIHGTVYTSQYQAGHVPGTDSRDLNWNNTTYFSDLFWRSWIGPDPSPPFSEETLVPPQPGMFGLDGNGTKNTNDTSNGSSSSCSSNSNNTNTTSCNCNSKSSDRSSPSTVTVHVDQLLDRLASLQQQLMLAKSTLSLVVCLGGDDGGLLTQPTVAPGVSSRLAAMGPALSLAHEIFVCIVGAGSFLQWARIGGPSNSSEEAKTMLAVAMPAMLALDLYRDAIQLITSTLHVPLLPHPWAVTPPGRGNDAEISATPSSALLDPPACFPGDLQAFLTLATLQYYLARMEQAMGGGERAEDGGGASFVALSMQQLASTVRDLRSLVAHGMHRVLRYHPTGNASIE